MKKIFISFSLKPLKEAGETFETAILPVMEALSEKYSKTHQLHHGFLKRETLEEKGWPVNVVDALDRLFPSNVSYANGLVPDRAKMLGVAVEDAFQMEMDEDAPDDLAIAFEIGPHVEGAAEEFIRYEYIGIKCEWLPWATDAIPKL